MMRPPRPLPHHRRGGTGAPPTPPGSGDPKGKSDEDKAIDSDPIAPLTASARQAFARGNFTLAVRILQDAIAAETARYGSPSARTIASLGNALNKARRSDEAIAALRWSLRIREHPVAWRNMGIILRDAQRFDEALTAFNRGIEMEKGAYGVSFLERGIALRMMGRLPDAAADFNRVIDIGAGNRANALYQLGLVFQQQGRWNESLAQIEEAIAQTLRSDRLHHLAAGVALRELGRPEEALAAIDRALLRSTREDSNTRSWKRRARCGNSGVPRKPCASSRRHPV